jgi:hypothetical protein
MSIFSTLYYILKWPGFDLFFLIYQGILVNLLLVVGYLIILYRFKAYHKIILDRFERYMSEKEREAINKTTLDV